MEYNDYSLKHIAEWMLNPSELELPAVQRGFVWKPAQIENVWDSIFRDYPVGSFMLTAEGHRKMLLDGQQRATSVALGFYNPWKSELGRIGNAKDLPVIWIDLAPDEVTDTCEFVFRVTTRSHPWGYQLKRNYNILSVPDRRAAMDMYIDLYGQKVYTLLSASQRLPFDAYLPIPLSFLFETFNGSNTSDEWKQKIIERCNTCIPKGYHPGRLAEEKDYHESLNSIDFERFFKIVGRVLTNYRIPAISIDNSLILSSKDNAANNPTLFVRLNSAGTNLEGEELIYSIYKAVYPQSKDLVENIGSSIIAPSRTITLASRLIMCWLNKRYYAAINLVQFQNELKKEEFRSQFSLLTGTGENDSELAFLVNRAIDILKYDGTIPDVIVKKFIRDSPNGLLLLMNWLSANREKVIDERLKKAICSKLYRLYWFGDLNDVVKTTWDNSTDENYWEQRVCNYGGYALHPMTPPVVLESFLLERAQSPTENHSITEKDTEIWDLWASNLTRPEDMNDESFNEAIRNGWANFLWRLLGNKSLILLAQREYINREFSEFNQFQDLQDTNTPWDWDHIYPQSWVYYQQNIDDRTRLWEWRIGNFRAMSLTDNRSENNSKSPAERFETPNKDYFILENDLKYWSQLTNEHKYIKAGDSEYVLIHAKAIIIRSVNIYREFYSLFA